MDGLDEPALFHELFRLRGGEHNNLDVLGGVKLLLFYAAAAGNKIAVCKVAEARGIGRHLAEKHRFIAGISGFFQKLPLYGRRRILVGFLDAAGREFQKNLLCAMAVLPDKDKIPVLGDGHRHNEIRD